MLDLSIWTQRMLHIEEPRRVADSNVACFASAPARHVDPSVTWYVRAGLGAQRARELGRVLIAAADIADALAATQAPPAIIDAPKRGDVSAEDEVAYFDSLDESEPPLERDRRTSEAELLAALVKALRGFEALYAEAMASTPNVLRIVEIANDVLGSTGSVQGRAILADAAIDRARGTAAEAQAQRLRWVERGTPDPRNASRHGAIRWRGRHRRTTGRRPDRVQGLRWVGLLCARPESASGGQGRRGGAGMSGDRATLVRCARCNAPSGEPCVTVSGQVHVVRVRLWQAMGCPGPAQMPKGRPTPKRPTPERAVLKAERRRERRLRNRDRARAANRRRS